MTDVQVNSILLPEFSEKGITYFLVNWLPVRREKQVS
jgi:hypothetical protein